MNDFYIKNKKYINVFGIFLFFIIVFLYFKDQTDQKFFLVIVFSLINATFDLLFRKIPNSFSLPSLLFALVFYLINYPQTFYAPLLYFGVLFFLSNFIPNGIGGGDIKAILTLMLFVKPDTSWILWTLIFGYAFVISVVLAIVKKVNLSDIKKVILHIGGIKVKDPKLENKELGIPFMVFSVPAVITFFFIMSYLHGG